MSLVGKLWALRWVRILAYGLSVFAVLTVGAWVAIVVVLNQNNVTIGRSNFDFPATLSLTDVKVSQPDLKAEIGNVTVDWYWGALFSKEFIGDHIRVENAHINVRLSDSEEPAPATGDSKLIFAYGGIHIVNSSLTLQTQTDSIAINIPDFKISGLAVRDSILVDSLVDNGNSIQWTRFGQKANHPKLEKSTEPLTINAIPDFSVGSLVLDKFGFQYQDSIQKHTVSEFDLSVSSFKSRDLLNAAIHKLKLTYQDTLSLELKLNHGLVNNSQEGTLTNLKLAFPWFAFDIPKIQFATHSGLAVSADITSASLNSSLLKFLTPAAASLANNVNTNFSGSLQFVDDRISSNRFLISTQGIDLILKGYADMPGKRADSVNMTVSNLNVSSIELAAFLGVPLPKALVPVTLGSRLMAQGTYNNITVAGDVQMNGTPAQFTIGHQQLNTSSSNLSASLSGNNFDLAKFYSPVPASLSLSHFRVQTTTLFDQEFNPAAIDVFFTADSATVNDLKIPKPDISLHYNNDIASGIVTIDNKTKLRLDSLSLRDINDLQYAGSIDTKLPHLIRANEFAGDLATHFNGYLKQSERGLDLKVILDKIQFKGAQPGLDYTSHGQLHVVNNDKSMAVNARLGNGVLIDFISTPEFAPWIQRKDRWEVNYPETYLNLKLKVDSALIHQFTGYHGQLDISHLNVKATHKTFEWKMKVPVAQFQDYSIENIEVNHTRKDDRKAITVSAASLHNPYTPLNNLKIDLGVKSDSVYALTFDTYLPEVKDEIDVDLLIEFLKDGIKVVPDESKPMRFGNQKWYSHGSDGIVLDDQGEVLFSHLILLNGRQKINALTKRDSIHVSVESFNLQPLLSLAMPDSTLTGILNLNTSYNISTNDGGWVGRIDSIFCMKAPLGALITRGKLHGEQMDIRANLFHKDSRVHVQAHQHNGPLQFSLESSNFDLGVFNAMDAMHENNVVLNGKFNGKIDGSYNEQLTCKGYLTLNDTRVNVNNLMAIKANQDTVWINNYMTNIHRFRLLDNDNNHLDIKGQYNLLENALEVSMESQKFNVLDARDSKGEIRGSVDIATALHIKNPGGQLEIRGHLNALPSSSVTYVYASEITLDERSKEVEFIQFDKIKEKEVEIRRFEHAQESSDPITWDVTTNIASTDIMVIFSEATEDFLKMTANGNLMIKSGSDRQPLVFGNIEGQSGRLVYDLPMVSDLDFAINSVQIAWNGDMTKPHFSFEGSELFRITPNDISSNWQNNKDRVPVTVLAKVNDAPIDNFDIHFDLKSTNQQVASWIQTLPENTREVNAISLLVFGKINTAGTGEQGNALVQSMVTKMNELSRRNVKNADLSFYVDTKKASETANGTVSNLGYSFSKPLFNKRFRLTLGGMLDLHGTQAAQSRSNALGSIKLDYVLKTEPDITVNITKRGTYDGVINGQVDESSLGVSFVKRFKNLFYKNKSN